jgi:hypothetical protein
MHHRHLVAVAALAATLALPLAAQARTRTSAPIPAQAVSGARLISVTPKDGGCVAGPTGPNVEAWDVQPGKTYTVTIDHVTDCANGGTDATIQLIVKSTALGNTVVTANQTATGTYAFDYLIPFNACETSPIQYCTTNGAPNTGFTVGRHDTGLSQAHLRASTFGANCSSPTPITCGLTPTQNKTWGEIKQYYR